MFRHLLCIILSALGLAGLSNPASRSPALSKPSVPKSKRSRDADRKAIAAAEYKRLRKNARRAREFYGKKDL